MFIFFFFLFFFFFNDTATTEIYTLSLHDALPSWRSGPPGVGAGGRRPGARQVRVESRSEEHTSESSHANISYAVFCLKKKKKNKKQLNKKKKKNKKNHTHTK